MTTPVLDLIQSALENVQRVIDVHGYLTTGDDPDEMSYSLDSAVEDLQAAEKILEGGTN